MLVRMLHGRMAGDLQEVPFHIGRMLIADGRAELPDPPLEYETRPAAVMAQPVQVRTEDEPRRGKRNGRKRV